MVGPPTNLDYSITNIRVNMLYAVEWLAIRNHITESSQYVLFFLYVNIKKEAHIQKEHVGEWASTQQWGRSSETIKRTKHDAERP